ncbi:serine/threonine-protein phosphatase 7 long form-like protein [Senna tora]|uniref:Serine/threonine-protein phosphatase 7 long form-like protein n=1 Tax=Senna tora TaxID=362788 RepID=A0A834TQC9_9FABA|nr:serine/threonine-protein phosphatase 7 long form-like protein [Senna tora]
MQASKSCLPLLASMISFFDADTSCFHFNNHSLCFGLEDVYYLTGLPINGKAVIDRDYGLDTLCFELLGKINYFTVTNQRRKNCIKLRQLRIDFQNVDDDVNDLELDKHVRGYVLYVIGCVISVDETNDNVPAMYLSFLENVNEIGSYAWGSALLANINYWLVKYKRNPTDHGVKAMLFFVQLFAFERLDALLPPNREELKLTGVDTLILCMNKVAWHRPSFSPRQLWCPTVPLEPYPLNIKPRSGKGLDWSLEYDGYVREWDQRNQRFMELSNASQADARGMEAGGAAGNVGVGDDLRREACGIAAGDAVGYVGVGDDSTSECIFVVESVGWREVVRGMEAEGALGNVGVGDSTSKGAGRTRRMSMVVAVSGFLAGFDLGSTTGGIIDENVKRRQLV